MPKRSLLTIFSLMSVILATCTYSYSVGMATEETLTPEPKLTPDPMDDISLLISPEVPNDLIRKMKLPTGLNIVDANSANTIILGLVDREYGLATWLYVLVAPFPTISDGITLDELIRVWNGGEGENIPGSRILVSPETMRTFEIQWGESSVQNVMIIPSETILDQAWKENNWAIIPFEELGPKWKVIAVDENSPLLSRFDIEEDPLSISYGFVQNGQSIKMPGFLQQEGLKIPGTNFNPDHLTSILMTGTTALVRSTAERMETKGIAYPGKMIDSVLKDADFTHISNEVSFSPICPKPNPMIVSLRFCSNPDYIKLLCELDIDIVELTGNHLMDYNPDAFQFTLDLYQKNGYLVYGGGLDLDQARKALTFTHHGNQIAFIGCNAVGPDFVWANEDSPGVASCDFEWMNTEVAKLAKEGYLVVATLQDGENYDTMPMPWVKEHLDQISESGAIIVSGSQAHFPQGFSFTENGFVHYGLGNLFFDQMDYPLVGIRREFYDKHFLYEGRYINTIVLTGMLEDYAQPRLMTAEERALFLAEIFKASGW